MRRLLQHSLHCRCGKQQILAHGLCPTCYTLRRQDEMCFGGMREAVLERDGYRCRVCGAPGRRKRSIIVHHRVPGVSLLPLMISLCPGCHSKVHRIKVMRTSISPLLVELWREQHPTGHEQTLLNFHSRQRPQETMSLFADPASLLHIAHGLPAVV